MSQGNSQIPNHNRGWETVSSSNNVQQQPLQNRLPALTTQSKVLDIIKDNKTEHMVTPTQTAIQPSENGLSEEVASTVPRREQQLTLPVLKSVLSVNAKEFVPQTKKPDYGGADALNKFSSLSLQEVQGDQTSSGSSIYDRFTNALCVLNYNPGNMVEYLRPICDMIKSCDNDTTEDIMNRMVESLFEQSISEPNFRYTGARICQYLSKNLKSNTYFSGFHKVLMRRCQREYEKREELIEGTDQDQGRLRGLAMFMAEIFLNVEIEDAVGNLSRLHYLPKVLTDFVQTLLSHPLEQEVKCCCQLLKLAGALIEDFAKNDPKLCTQFEEIFINLSTLKGRAELSSTTKVLAGSVIQLKEQNWNRSTLSPQKKGGFAPHLDTVPFQQEPVFYNTMGIPCSRREANLPPDEDLGDDGAYVLNDEEEAAFLAWQEEEGLKTEDSNSWINDTGYDSYQLEILRLLRDDISDDGGMGDDLEAAYEEFLQEQKQTMMLSSSKSRGGHHHQGGRGGHHQQQASHHYHSQPQQQMTTPSPYVYTSMPQVPHHLQGFNMQPMMQHPGFMPQQQHPHSQNQMQYPQQQQQHQQQQQQPPSSHGYPYHHHYQ